MTTQVRDTHLLLLKIKDPIDSLNLEIDEPINDIVSLSFNPRNTRSTTMTTQVRDTPRTPHHDAQSHGKPRPRPKAPIAESETFTVNTLNDIIQSSNGHPQFTPTVKMD